MKKRAWIAISLVAPLVMTLSGQPAAQNLDLGTEAQQQGGKVLYDKYCAQCHGVDGDGEGYGAPFMRPRPRDFTSGKFKIRTTPSGALPTHEDLRRVIREGMPYTTMIGWPDFSQQDVDNLIYYIQTFSDDFKNPDYYEQPIAVPDPPSYSPESAEQGREVYVQMECSRCHGDEGRGDGSSAPSLVNDAGETLLPADLTKRWTYRGGPTRRDIYRTFTTGLNGTPMPSYSDSLTNEQRWQLVDYVYSLGLADKPNYSELVVSKSIEDDLDLTQGVALFEAAESAFFPLVGQIIEPGRAFHPAANRIEVRAVHNNESIAFLLRWHDMRADVGGTNHPGLEAPEMDETTFGAEAGENREGEAPAEPQHERDGQEATPPTPASGDDFWGAAAGEEETAAEPQHERDGQEATPSTPASGDGFWGAEAGEEGTAGDVIFPDADSQASSVAASAFSDAVAIQVPSVLPSGIRLPYFIFGDRENAVDIWFADLAQESPQLFVGRGSGSLTPGDPEGMEMRASYDAGAWTVMFKRERRLEDAMAIEDDQWYPVAFSVWEGWSEDRGNKRALSRWYYVYVESGEKVRPAGPMAKAALATLGIEIILIVLLRRKYRNGWAGEEAPGESERPA